MKGLKHMGMTTTMLQDDIGRLAAEGKARKDIVELFYQRLYNIVDHLKFDINSLRENTLIKLDDLKDLYMITDMYTIQIEEVVDKILNDDCEHIMISGVNGSKICTSCNAKIA